MNADPNAGHEHDGAADPFDRSFDRQVAGRLAALRTMPVDTSRLDAALRAVLPPPPSRRAAVAAPGVRPRAAWFRPLRAVAASLVLMSAVAAVVLLSAAGGPALASPAEMARMHDELVTGRVPVVRVDSIDQAGRALNEQWPDRPDLPAAPESHVMACCMKSVKNKRVACVLLRTEGVPITMTVARAADMRLPKSPAVDRDGVTVPRPGGRRPEHGHDRARRAVGLPRRPAPAERLMDVAARLRF
jgi:hypothetical protein